MWSLFLRIIAAIAGLFLAKTFVSGVMFNGSLFLLPTNEAGVHAFIGTLTFIGIFLGILNSIVKPLLDKITFPLRIITLNLFGLIVAMAMIWITDIIFTELNIKGIVPLFWTTVIVFALSFVLVKWLPVGKKS
jgi:putative membrane protein